MTFVHLVLRLYNCPLKITLRQCSKSNNKSIKKSETGADSTLCHTANEPANQAQND